MTAMIGNGTTLGVGDGASPEVFSTIGEVVSISGPNQTAAVADTTNLSSTARTFIRGLEDAGEINVECNLDPADTAQDAVYTAFTAGTAKNYKLSLTDSAPVETVTFSALVTAYGISVAIDQTTKLNFTLKVSGNTTWA
jgi:hypothetical protein